MTLPQSCEYTVQRYQDTGEMKIKMRALREVGLLLGTVRCQLLRLGHYEEVFLVNVRNTPSSGTGEQGVTLPKNRIETSRTEELVV